MSVVKSYIERQLFKPPDPRMLFPVAFEPSDLKKFYTETSRQIFEATSIPNISVLSPNAKRIIVYFHGNSENLVTLQWFISAVSEVLHADVFAFEYPGYNIKIDIHTETQVEPKEQTCFAAAERFCTAIKELQSELPVYFFGYSMGCAIALHASEYFKRMPDFPKGIVLLSPFVSAASVVLAPTKTALFFSPLWSAVDVFSMKHAALEQGKPILVFAGGQDEVVPKEHSEKIAEIASKHSKVCIYREIPEATHSSIRIYADVWEEFTRFVENLELNTSAAN
jgi:alpha-beta hydrolase superfamily lysophospholipase